jgi:hypothetical protein
MQAHTPPSPALSGLGLDIIGDIHGHAPRLVRLLAKLGYKKRNNIWTYPDRKRIAVFLGDFIDRGPAIPETVSIARNMVETGHALAIMGNHEYNAIAYDTPVPRGDFARPHTMTNTVSHAETLRQYHAAFGRDGEKKWKNDIAWFTTLPIFIDMPDLRVAHACWDDASIKTIQQHLGDDPRLDRTLIAQLEASRKAPLSVAVNTVLKGSEFDLHMIDPDLHYTDSDGVERHATRIKWWHHNADDMVRLGDVLFDVPDHAKQRAVPLNMFRDNIIDATDPRPVMMGHYWMKGTPQIQTPHVACLDFSVARDGVLTAYRFNAEKTLDNKNLVYV